MGSSHIPGIKGWEVSYVPEYQECERYARLWAQGRAICPTVKRVGCVALSSISETGVDGSGCPCAEGLSVAGL